MPIQSGKYVTPAWQNGGAPAITAEELTAIGQSIEQNQDDIEQNAQDIESLQTQQSTINGQISSIQSGYLQKSGGTMTGNLILNADPTQNMQAATKQYVDSLYNYIVGSGYAGVVINVKNSNEPLQNVDLYYSPQNGVKTLFGNLTDIFGNCIFAVKPGTSYTFRVASNTGASFADITSSSVVVPSTVQAGKIYYYSFSASLLDYYELLSGNKTIRFSSAVSRIDVSLVGGGSAGGAGRESNNGRSGDGGDGGKILNKTNVSFSPNTSYTIAVGAGGIASTDSFSQISGSPSTAFGLSSENGVSGGMGGNGGNVGSSEPDNGTVASANRYSDFSSSVECSGGGGSGGYYAGSTRAPGTGATNGGDGGRANTKGKDATGIGGGGGGAGGSYSSSGSAQNYFLGGNGGPGYIGIRIYH